jgi:hypothetical protein
MLRIDVYSMQDERCSIKFLSKCFTAEKSLGSKTILLSYCPLFLSNLHFILVCLFLCGEKAAFIKCGSPT